MPAFDKVISDGGCEGGGHIGMTHPFLPFYPLSLLETEAYFARPFTKKVFVGKKEFTFTRVLFLIHNEEYNRHMYFLILLKKFFSGTELH